MIGVSDVRVNGSGVVQLVRACLDRFRGPSLVLSADGQIVYANPAARQRAEAWTLERCHDDPSLELVELEGTGGHFLVVDRDDLVGESGRIAELARTWGLTDRQRQVFARLVRGADNPEIARDLGCSPRTVEVHVTEILKKSGCANRAEVAAMLWLGSLSGDVARPEGSASERR